MGYEVFDLDVMKNRYRGLRIDLAGRHQIENAAVSVLAVNVLNKKGFNVNEKAVRKGLEHTYLPSRFELVKAGGRIYCLDGAHNAESAGCLSDTVKRNFKGKKAVTLIIGMSADKDIVGTCRELNHMASTVIVTRSGNPRAALPGDIAKMFKGERVLIAGDAKDAVKIAGRISRAGDIILVTGSFYLTGEVKELLAHASKK
jgi:dihydrofolate synthase/folylpolyglutamate synthase